MHCYWDIHALYFDWRQNCHRYTSLCWLMVGFTARKEVWNLKISENAVLNPSAPHRMQHSLCLMQSKYHTADERLFVLVNHADDDKETTCANIHHIPVELELVTISFTRIQEMTQRSATPSRVSTVTIASFSLKSFMKHSEPVYQSLTHILLNVWCKFSDSSQVIPRNMPDTVGPSPTETTTLWNSTNPGLNNSICMKIGHLLDACCFDLVRLCTSTCPTVDNLPGSRWLCP